MERKRRGGPRGGQAGKHEVSSGQWDITVTTLTKTKTGFFSEGGYPVLRRAAELAHEQSGRGRVGGNICRQISDDIVFVKDMFSERQVDLNCHTQYFEL